MSMGMKKRVRTALALLGMMLCLALSAGAAGEYGEANITPDTLMTDIRANPSIIGSGVYTYGNSDERYFLYDLHFGGMTLREYVNQSTAEDVANVLNLIVTRYNAGEQITYPVYTAQQIAEVPSRQNVELYYFPVEGAAKPYVLVLGGNAFVKSGELNEGLGSVWDLHQKGYPAFVLRYRTWLDLSDNAPYDDLCAAVQYITDRAADFNVQAEDYAILAYSSGGQLAGLFSNYDIGYGKLGLPKPGALLLAYPINNYMELKPVYQALYDPLNPRSDLYYWTNVSDLITPYFPPTYVWYGRNDLVLNLMWSPSQAQEIADTLAKNGVRHELRVYDDAAHATGVSHRTDANGWLDEAVAFWEKQTAQ